MQKFSFSLLVSAIVIFNGVSPAQATELNPKACTEVFFEGEMTARIPRLRRQAEIAVQHKHFTRAIEFAQRILSLDANDVEAHKLIGTISLQLRDYPTAIDHFYRLIALEGFTAENLKRITTTYLSSGQSQPGFEAFEMALDRGLVNLTFVKAVYQSLNTPELQADALSFVNKWLETHEEDYAVEWLRIKLWIAQANLADASSAVAKWLEKKPSDRIALELKLQILLKLQQCAEGVKLADQILHHDPGAVAVLRLKAEALMGIAQHDLALAVTNRILQLHKRHAGALGLKTEILIHLGLYDQAIELTHDHHRIQPLNPAPFLFRAEAYLAKGLSEPAQEAIDAVLARYPTYFKALALKVLALYKAGRSDHARLLIDEQAKTATLQALALDALFLARTQRLKEAQLAVSELSQYQATGLSDALQILSAQICILANQPEKALAGLKRVSNPLLHTAAAILRAQAHSAMNEPQKVLKAHPRGEEKDNEDVRLIALLRAQALSDLKLPEQARAELQNLHHSEAIRIRGEISGDYHLSSTAPRTLSDEIYLSLLKVMVF